MRNQLFAILSKEFFDIQATIEYRFTLKRVCGMTITYSLLLVFHLYITLYIRLKFYLNCTGRSPLTLSRRRPLSYRNQLRKSMDWFLYDNGLRLERVNSFHATAPIYSVFQYSAANVVWNCEVLE